MPPPLEASGGEKMGSHEVTCACTPHFIYNPLLPFGPSHQSLGGLGLVAKIFFRPDGLCPSERAAFFGGASRVMFGHGRPISGIFSTDKNRVRAQPKNGYVLSKFPVLTAHDQPGQPPVLRAKTGPTRALQAACVLCFCVRCFFYSPPPPSPVRLPAAKHGNTAS